MKIALAGLQHETNTFAPDITEAVDFLAPGGWPKQARGEAVKAELAGTSVPMAGGLRVLEDVGATAVPLLWTIALPAGPVRHAAFEALAEEIAERLKEALPVDGLFLELHGAMATTEDDDAEGALLEKLRDLVGPDLPIVVALDLHTNLSARMVQNADQLFAYLTYPHVDMADTGARAMRRLLEFAEGAPRPNKAFRQMPYLLPIVAQGTASAPVKDLYCAAMERSDVETMLTLGFPLADVPDAGPALVVYGHVQEKIDAAADETLSQWVDAEPEFETRLSTAAEGVALAMQATKHPVVIADVQDNAGGGGANDTTGLLRALVDAKAEGALMVHIADANAANAATQAGVGAVLDIGVGGQSDPETGDPVKGPWRVIAVGDGRFTGVGPMYSGAAIEMGPVALLEQSGVRVIVAGKRMQASEPALIHHLGLDPATVPILCVKSSVHFRGAYENMAQEIILVATPGRVIMDLNALNYMKSRRRAAGIKTKTK
jgi:microcystin degradation protein MlrC